MSRGERRLHAREAALSLDRLKQRGLLATNVGASADADFNIKRKARAKNIFTEQICFSGFVQGIFKNRQNVGIFRADVNVSLPCANGIRRDQHPFDRAVRIVDQQDAVFERAWLGLVRVADHILFGSRVLLPRLPI